MTSNFKNNDFADITLNRKSVKVFDKDYKISHEEMLEMIQEATTAPSSVNMQSWRFVVAESDEAKATLHPLVRFNTRQNETSSAMVLVFGDMKNYEYAEEIYGKTVADGHMDEATKNQLLDAYIPYYESFSKEVMNDVVKIDASLAAMQFMLIARAHGYETNPIGGFEADQLAEAFGMDKDRYIPVMIIAIGKGAVEGHGSSRLPAEKLTSFK
ncbi:nitroreductase family protein [Lactococcus termiticola]|uniref:Nitroreductase n=1 Tax=Lactococcus termiticola TaxID=2169526 RepID=A0A2R5HDC7_9LACT|nr:nitroreductase family protein [Lactococcus termiticola]GBG96084.1 nitroreductase [Lactococcus termiticola]